MTPTRASRELKSAIEQYISCACKFVGSRIVKVAWTRYIVMAQTLRQRIRVNNLCMEVARSWSVQEPYMIPIPNMQLSATFLLLAICNPHSIGMGKTTTTTSCSRFKMAIYISRDL